MTTESYIGLGSNLGDRKGFLRRAILALRKNPLLTVQNVSSLYETEAWGETGQPAFLNAVAQIETQTDALGLLRILQGIEADLGRVRTKHWGPRVIDLDILLFGHEVIAEETLRVPHPELARRKFVLAPLLEVNPEAFHPALGKNIRRIWDETGAEVRSQRVELLEKGAWYD